MILRASGEKQTVLAKMPHDLATGMLLQEGTEDQLDAFLDLQIRVFDDGAIVETDVADGKRKGQLAALGLIVDSCGEPTLESMKLQLRTMPFIPSKSLPLGVAGS